jgi:hypothetical protein
MAFIVIEKGNLKDTGKRIPLEEKTVLIGRGAPGNEPEIALDDEYISRRHAEIIFDQDCYRLRDLNSTNGTSLDNNRLEPGNTYLLQDDSLIGLGITAAGAKILLRFKGSPTVSTTRYNGELPAPVAPVSWLKIDESRGEIRVDEKPLVLPRKEYALITCLYNKAGKVCSREELISEVWPEVIDTAGVTDAAIDQLIYRLRSKIEADPSQPRRLVSRRGFGFMLI